MGDYWGNGGDWAASASAAGFTVDNTPVANSTVAVFAGGVRGGSYGHVAVVLSVQGSTMTIGEAIDEGSGYHNVVSSGIPVSQAVFIHV